MSNGQLQLVNYGQAKALKALGFDFPTRGYYRERYYNAGLYNWNNDPFSEDYSAPTVSLALKWCRDVKGVKYDIYYDCFGWDFNFSWKHGNGYEDYNDAESVLLDAVTAKIKRQEGGAG